MVTVNKRVGAHQAHTINGIDAGGVMTARIQAGFDEQLESSPDGLTLPIRDKGVQFVRGTIVTQDWVEFVNLICGTVSTYVFYERKSGVAEATGYIKHTITAPVIHRVNMRFTKGQYAAVAFDFECRAADVTTAINDMWAITDDQAAPTYITAARGGWRIEAAVHGATSIYHLSSFEFTLAMPVAKACNDGDVGYTCVDARTSGMSAAGSIGFADSTVATSIMLCNKLLTAAAANLVLTVRQSGGATDKTVTIANVDFNDAASNSDSNPQGFTAYQLSFAIANSSGTPLTLAGDNQIIAIADVV